MPNEQTYMPKIGVDMAYYAKLLVDPVDGVATYSESKRLPGLVKVGFAPNSQAGTFFADNAPYATATQLGDMKVTVECADLPPQLRAEWFGQKYTDGLLDESQINPIDMAFMYRVKKSNGAHRYIAIYKTKPGVPNEDVSTQTNSINFQSGSFELAVAQRICDGMFRRILDDDDPKLPVAMTPAIIKANFFTDPNWDLLP